MLVFKSIQLFLRTGSHLTKNYCSCSSVMREMCIEPDLVKRSPDNLINVQYPSGVRVELGNILTPREVQSAPKVKWPLDVRRDYYCMFLLDPDAPNRKSPTHSPWLHWLVGNIPKSHVSQGDVLAGYVGAGPPQYTGYHRYVFLVYQQKSKVNFQENIISSNDATGRDGFKFKSFISKYDLTPVPVAGNFFLAQFDDFVPLLYRKLGVGLK